MAQDAQTRVQKAILQLIRDLDQTCLRKIQGDMHRCASKCCDDTNASMESTHDCVNKCSQKFNSLQTYVENEMTSYQNRLERCVLQCQDDVRDKIGANTSESEMNKFTNQFEVCVVKCADTHIDLIPNMLKKMRDIIQKGSYVKEVSSI